MTVVKNVRVSLPQIQTIGVPGEIKPQENRVALTPHGAHRLSEMGMRVLVQSGAGLGSDFRDEEYQRAGAWIEPDVRQIFKKADMVMKVKEPIDPKDVKELKGRAGIYNEFEMLRPGQLLFTYLHLGAKKELALRMASTEATGIAYETVQLPDRSIPMLTPMSQIAGRMAPIVAAGIGRAMGSSGKLMCGVPGVDPQNVLIIGGGVVGSNAALIALGMRANVRMLDLDPGTAFENFKRMMAENKLQLGMIDNPVSRMVFYPSNDGTLAESLNWADTIIGAVLVRGANAPKLVKQDFFKAAKPGKVIVDVAIDQGGMTAMSHATTHFKPTYIVDSGLNVHEYGDYSTPGTVMYCVGNMPGFHARTATLALTATTLPYAERIIRISYGALGWSDVPELKDGVNTFGGYITFKPITETLGIRTSFEQAEFPS